MNDMVRKHLPAFSLIEIMVVTAIISIASAIIMVQLSASRATQYVSSAATEVEATVRGAQNFALTGAQKQPGTKPCRFRVTWEGSTYSVWYHYKDNADACTQSMQLSSRVLSDGVAFDGDGNFEFTLPHAVLGSDQQIILTKGDVSQAVCLYTSGNILSVVGSECP